MSASAADAAPPAATLEETNLRWSAFKNSAAQAVGRVLIALSRLLLVAIIVRGAGSAVFAQYSLLFGILTLAEWLVDFGTTDIFVREICREPGRRQWLMRVLTAARLIQIPVAIGLVGMILVALRYETVVIEAGMVGAAGLVFFGGVLLYRTIFKATLKMEREMVAELVSVLLIIPLIWWVVRSGGGLTALFACHVLSRGIFFGICFFLGRRSFVPSIEGVGRADIRWAMGMSMAVGLSGLLVVVYETIDLILLSRLATLTDLAWFSAAYRFVWPLLMTQAAIGGTLYAVAASYWPAAREKFEQACQRGIDSVFLIAGVAISGFVAGAEFIMGLLGPEVVGGADALRILALLCFVKAISGTIGPVLFVVHAQKAVLYLVAGALVVKAIGSAWLAIHYGYLGVAAGAVAIDTLFVAAPSVWLVRKYSGFRVRWGVPARVVLLTAIASGAAVLVPAPAIVPAILAPSLFAILALATKTVKLSELRSLFPAR